MPVAFNDKGEAVRLDESGQWQPAKTAKNPQTGETMAFDGQNWLAVKKEGGGVFKFVDDVVRQLAKGATFGGADDLIAAGRAAGGEGSFQENLTQETSRDKAFEQEHPVVSTGAQIVGGVAGTLAAGSLAGATRLGAAGLNLLSKAPRVVQGATVGTGVGAVSGAGFSEGDISERLGDAAVGAALGGTIGAAAPVVFGLVSQFGKAAIRPIIDRIGKGPEKAGLRKILEAMERDKITPAQAQARIKALGNEATLADVGPNVSGVAEAAANRPGVALERATDVFSTRRSGQVNRIVQSIDDAIGPPGQHVIEKIEESPAFRRAIEQSIPVDESLLSLLQRPSMKTAWNKARVLAREDDNSLPPLAEFIDRVRAGEIVEVKTKVMHWLKKGLDDVLEPNRDPVTGFVQSKVGQNQTIAQNETRKAFRTLVKDKNPDYANSLERIATSKRLDGAYKDGTNFFRLKSPGDVTKQMARLNEAEVRAYQRGIRDGIENRIRDKGELGFDTTRFVLNQGQKIKAAFGNKADTLIKSLQNERVFTKTEGRVLGNSRTAFRQAAGEDLGIDPSLVASAARGDVVGLGGGLLRQGMKALSGPSQSVSDELGGLLFNQGAGANAAAVNQLSQNAGARALRSSTLRQIENVLAVGGGQQAGRSRGPTSNRR